MMEWTTEPLWRVFEGVPLWDPPTPTPEPQLSEQQKRWRAEKKLNRHRKRLERAYGRPLHQLLALINGLL
jgi:hypothetical protein